MVRLGSSLGLTAALLITPLLAMAQTPTDNVAQAPDREQIREMRQNAQATRGGAVVREGRAGGGGGRGVRQGGRVDFPAGGFPAGGFGGAQAQAGGFRGGGGIPVAPQSQPATAAALDAVVAPPSIPATAAGLPQARPPVAADALTGLGSRVTAVLDISTSPHLLINENEHGVIDTRDLAVGEEYRDGWRLASVGANSVTMKKGEEQRQVVLAMNTGIGRVPIPAAPSVMGVPAADGTQTAPGRGALSLSNGASGAVGAGRGGAQVAQGQDLAALAGIFGRRIDPAQAQAMASQIQSEMQRTLAELPPSIRDDPRAAAAIAAMQSGDINGLLSQVQSALGPNGGLSAPAGGGAGGLPLRFQIPLSPGAQGQ